MKNLGAILILVFTVIPLLLWLPSTSGEFNFRHLGQILSLTGVILFSINFILSARLKFLEKFFNGLNQMYIIHHLVGETALLFLLFHPISIAAFYMKISLGAAFEIIFPPFIEGFATWFGLLALLTLMTLLILTLYVKLPYNIWKKTHQFMGLALFFALIHVIFIDSTVRSNLLLRYYILTFFALGFASYTYRTLLGRVLVPRSKFKVLSVKVTNAVTRIILSPIENAFSFNPGQFIFIKFNSAGITKEEHPFSLTGSPNDQTISIAAKVSGDYTQTLKTLRESTEATVEGPFGAFSYLNCLRKRQIWIAGGIGITPFVSMAKSLNKDSVYDIVLYYIVKEPNEAVFLDELSQISKNIPNFKLIPFYTQQLGHLTAEKIVEENQDYQKREIFICGPVQMMDSMRNQLNKLGVSNLHIKSEEFALN